MMVSLMSGLMYTEWWIIMDDYKLLYYNFFQELIHLTALNYFPIKTRAIVVVVDIFEEAIQIMGALEKGWKTTDPLKQMRKRPFKPKQVNATIQNDLVTFLVWVSERRSL